jgi:hypothetical protein
MLVINSGRGVTSEAGAAALFPYVLRDLRDQALRAEVLLTGGAGPDWLAPVLLSEIGDFGEVTRLADWRAPGIVHEAARRIAYGSIRIAERIPGAPRLEFFPRAPRRHDFGQAVRFANDKVAARFLDRCLADPVSRAAAEAALAFWVAANGQPQFDAGGLTAWLGKQLINRRLGCFPRAGDRGVLRLVWIRLGVIASLEAAAASPPPPPRPPASSSPPAAAPSPPAAAPAADAGDAGDDTSDQEQALIAAAQSGAPFCEECARQAAAAG